MIKKLELVTVMYVAANAGASGARDAFNQLESRLNTLKGRKFYGVLFGKPDNGEYRACVAADQAEANHAGLLWFNIPGGIYEQRKLWDWEQKLHTIGPLIDEVLEQYEFDTTRPLIEFYRSMKELRLLVPIKT